MPEKLISSDAARGHGRDELDARGVALRGEPVDDGPARVAEPQQLRDLVEGLARGVVARGPELGDGLGPRRVDAVDGGVAARDEQAHEGKARRLGVALAAPHEDRQQVPHRWSTPTSGLPARPRQPLGGLHADEQRADQARAVRHGDAVDVGEPRRPRGRARRERRGPRCAGGRARRAPARRRRSGACTLTCECTTSESTRPASSTSAAPVSSQDDSRPRTSTDRTAGEIEDGEDVLHGRELGPALVGGLGRAADEADLDVARSASARPRRGRRCPRRRVKAVLARAMYIRFFRRPSPNCSVDSGSCQICGMERMGDGVEAAVAGRQVARACPAGGRCRA